MQMQWQRTYRVVAAVFLLATAGCDDFLAVNDNPNAPETARIDLTLPAVIGTFGHSVLAGAPTQWGAEWMQQFSHNGNTRSYTEIHRYELSALNAEYPWNFTFGEVMNEARNIMRDSEQSEDWAYHGIAKLIFAWSYSYMTDMWGSVPYTQAFQSQIPDPVYDDQQTVYVGVHQMLEEAIADMQRTSPRVPTTNDLLFGGDMARWVQLAHAVQAQLHLRLAYAPGENAAARAQAALTALQGGLTSNADDADFAYEGGQAGWRQPWWALEDRSTFKASEFYVELLRGLADPRLPISIRPALLDSVQGSIVYRGHKNGGAAEQDSTMSDVSSYFSADSAALNWVSYADAKFIEAEAQLILNQIVLADAAYRAGIRANMEKMGVAAADITTYLAARPLLSTLTNPLEEIITQKYIANVFKAEVWHDWRRTGYPQLEIVEEAVLPGIPQRIRTPGSELSSNAVNVAATGVPPGLEGMTVRVWWASQGPPQ